MLSLDDTIVAIGTPEGRGGIGIVRLSGPAALAVAQRLFRPSARLARRPRALCYGRVVDPAGGEDVDEVLAAYLPAPHTYTRQDVVEIDAHGGPYVLRRILGLCLREGARAAGAGEFTLRAFANGRIDLTQAEAVRDLVAAGSSAAARQAVAQLDGRLGSRVRQARAALLRALAEVEVGIDFDEEDAPARDLGPLLQPVAAELADLLAGAASGIVRREGLHVAIIGRPNVGKSSLMNALLRAERAIVTPVPGTTRDTVEESASIGGVALVFVDTAGLALASTDPVERLGMARTEQAAQRADMALLVLDASAPLGDEDTAAARLAQRAPRALAVWNKCDLAMPTEPPPLDGANEVRVSALTGAGLADLEAALLGSVLGQAGDGAGAITTERQRDAAARALEAVRRAMAAAGSGIPADLVAIDVRAAVDALGEVTGETADEDLLATIFASFCVGK